MTREEKEQIGIYVLQMARLLEDGCDQQEMLLKAVHIIDEVLEQEPILDKINKMKSEIASSLEFWDYSPNNNPLARDILETVTHFWGDIREVEE